MLRLFLLLPLFIYSAVSLSGVPEWLEKDTIEKICDNVNCHSQLEQYYRTDYYNKKFNKALAVSSYKSSNKYTIDYFGMAWQYPDAGQAMVEALKGCRKHGKNCKIFLVNNRVHDGDLYRAFTKTVYQSSSNNQKCSNNFYKKTANSSCIRLPLNSNKYSSGVGFYCKSGFKKNGDSCSIKKTIPFNAHASGSNWICNIDFYRNDANTACIGVPANAYSTYNSNYFYCNSGYKKSGKSCIKENKVPLNAHADGNSWVCNTDYYKFNNRCARVPKNAYSRYTSNYFYCNSGYQKSGGSCIKENKIPVHAHADAGSWTCGTDYYKSNNSCRKVPKNAYSSYSSNYWYCLDGFKQSGGRCVAKKVIPLNAYKFGSSWVCNSNYYKNAKQTKCLRVPKNATKNLADNGWNCNDGYRKSGFICKEKSAQIVFNGHKYVGEINNYRKPHGYGTMNYQGGGSFSGEWKNGKENGKGTFVTNDGVSINGQFIESSIIGDVTVTYPTGNIYKGGFSITGSVIGRNGFGRMIYTDGQVKKGQWKNNIYQETETIQQKGADSNSYEIAASSGSGFAVSSDGYIVTNYHVIKGCNNVEVISKGLKMTASVIKKDSKNDLALLKSNFRPLHSFNLSPEEPYRNMSIIVAGFPFGSGFGSTVKTTRGSISNLYGIGDNPSQIQIDAAIQPGSSGGPIIDSKGNVVGVTASKLDLMKMLEEFGALPESTNFGIKSTVLINFLASNVSRKQTPSKTVITERRLGEIAENGTYYISCLMTMAQIEANKTKNMKQRKVLFNIFD